MRTKMRNGWLLVDWVSYMFVFATLGRKGTVNVLEKDATLEIEVIIDGKKTPLGMLIMHSVPNMPVTVTFSASGAGPNISFIHGEVAVTREVELPLYHNTSFNIVCQDEHVKSVTIAYMEGAILFGVM